MADHLVVRVGPTGRIFLFEDMSTGDTADSAFIRARTSSGRTLTAFGGGTIPSIGSSGDLAVYSGGLAPLPDGGLVYTTLIGSPADGPTIVTVHRAPDGRVVASHVGLPGVSRSIEDNVGVFTRLPGGSLRFCAQVGTGTGPSSIRLTGLTPALSLDTRLGPDGYRTLDVENCVGITSDAAGQVYVATTTTAGDGHLAIRVSALSSSGVPVTSWGENGQRTIAISGTDIALANTCRAFHPSLLRTLRDGSVVIPFDIRTPGTCEPAGSGVAWIKKAGDFTRIVTLGPESGRSRIFAADVDSSDRTVMSLGFYPTGGSATAYIARLTTIGVADTTFGTEGFVRVSRAPRDLDVDGLDRIVGVTADGATVVMTRRK
jgi:hypothetical protein